MPFDIPTYTDAYTGIKFIRISDVPEDDRAAFAQWMGGQTRPWINGIEPMDAVYVHDYQSWLDAKAGKPVLWD